MKVAITTMPSPIITVWLTPIMIEGMARGSCTLSRIWAVVEPKARAASTASAETCRIPRLVRRTAGGSA